MDKRTVISIIIILLAAMLACGFPGTDPDIDWDPTKTPTRMPACTPPACADDEVYYCPDECPGGCGTECATKTPGPATPSPSPTPTPMPMCTPPPCLNDEAYYCPDECPGGCGTECATRTPLPVTPTFTPSPTSTNTPAPTDSPTSTATVTNTPTSTPETLRIVTFNGSRSELDEGDELQVSWDVRGADDAYLEWTDSNRIRVREEPLVLPEGLLTLYPYRGLVTLTASKGLEQVSATLDLNISCPIPWAPTLEGLYPEFCPSDYNTSWAAYQPFEHGFMIWVEDDDLIYVYYDHTQSNSYFWYTDSWEEGDPESDPSIIPPSGLLQPVRGFGLVWRDNPDVRTNLGWATAGEQGYELNRYQYFPGIPSSRLDWFSNPWGAHYRMHPYTHAWAQVTP